MKSTNEWLDLLAKEYHTMSKAELARLLGVSRSSICGQRNDLYAVSTPTAVKIADLLGVYPMLVIASSMHDQSRKDEDRAFWEAIYKRYDRIEKRCPAAQICEKTIRAVTWQPPADWKKKL